MLLLISAPVVQILNAIKFTHKWFFNFCAFFSLSLFRSFSLDEDVYFFNSLAKYIIIVSTESQLEEPENPRQKKTNPFLGFFSRHTVDLFATSFSCKLFSHQYRGCGCEFVCCVCVSSLVAAIAIITASFTRNLRFDSRTCIAFICRLLPIQAEIEQNALKCSIVVRLLLSASSVLWKISLSSFSEKLIRQDNETLIKMLMNIIKKTPSNNEQTVTA